VIDMCALLILLIFGRPDEPRRMLFGPCSQWTY